MKRPICVFVLLLVIGTMADEKNVDQILRDGNNKFTAKMFHEVAKSKSDESVVLSAFSVMTPLAQLALASVGESHDELLDSIGMPNDNITKAAFSAVNTQIRATKGITLKTASKIYVTKGFELNSEFASATRDTFGSEIQSIDFQEKQKAADVVNSWVEEKTNNKIKDLVSPDTFTPSSLAVLVNAIYFKGAWKDPFNEYITKEKDFHVSKTEVIKVPTMFHSGHYKYVENKELQVQILEIPYEGDEASFVIVLPHEIDGIKELENKLEDPTILDKAMNDMESVEVEVFLPKFKIETKTDLKEILQKMGVAKLFKAETARLDNLLKTTASIFVDSAIQKAFIEINEKGAEAAAANEFGIHYSSAIISLTPPKVFKADRPFYFAIKSNSLTLFNGIYRK